MPDFADDASALEELALQQALQAHRNKGRQLAPKGTCHFCDSPLEKVEGKDVQLFCDVNCSKDWERQEKAKQRR
ncbi:hypothetical protein F6X40_17330 [Paraburkholderia sp. UCT31]|uniref:hypothetical protein n=1 Tax=Paraburkholderia sp. UCT31 TaxID=2615209 RepID=UPI00165655DD|nr:hypothetical protein [Paraburkholderia sp. UCT31]MBC8738524.1 hypothetical protein [Paraburkholderia sp. UCT31]